MERTLVLAIVSRIVTVVLAVVLLIVSAVIIGNIDNNEKFDYLLNDGTQDNVYEPPLPATNLLYVINGSLGVAGWLIMMCIVVAIADIAFVVINIKSAWNLIFGVVEIVINIALILHFLAAGFASAVIASKWRKEPWPCTVDPDAYGGDFCDIVLLMAMNSVQCVLCFLLVGALGVATAIIIYKSKAQTT